MFIITKSETYKWPVTITGIDQDGKTVKQSFTAIYHRLSQSELEEMSVTGLTDREFARKVLAGWEDVQDADGNEVPFSSATCERLLDNAGVAAQIVIEFTGSIGGARVKN